MEGEHAPGQPLVLERLPQNARARNRQAVVGERERAGVGELRHLGELLATLAARDGGEEAGRDARLVARTLAQRAQHRR